jgi:hypothetical protein
LPDGKVEAFKTRDDLERSWKDSYFRRSDYTRKTQEVAKRMKELDDRNKKFEDEMKAFQQAKSKYDTWGERLKNRPDVARQLEALAGRSASPDDLLSVSKGYADEKVSTIEKQLKELMSEREAEKLDRSLKDTYGRLKQEFEDFDEGSVESMLAELSDGNVEALARMAYFAGKGQVSPAQAEKRIAQNLQKKATAGMPRSGSAPVTQARTFKTVAEARDAALKDAGV